MAIQRTENNYNSPFHRPPSIKDLLDQTRRRIQVSDAELTEARRRRDQLAAALLQEFPESRTYVNGSVAHGDADLQERAANAIRTGLKGEFPDLQVEWKSRKRSILVRFRKPVSYGQDDFTADVIVAIDNPDGAGLYIPNHASWSRSHPEKHTTMVRAANKKTNYTYARIVRLLKHWNRRNQKPLCSWNIKARALGCLTAPMPLAAGMLAWFDYAIAELDKGLTEDPAGVAEKPISVKEKMTRTQVVDRLERARDRLVRAVELEKDGYPLQAHEELAKFFNDKDALPHPSSVALMDEVARKFDNDRRKSINAVTQTGRAATTTAAMVAPAVPVVGHRPEQRTPGTRSWGTR